MTSTDESGAVFNTPQEISIQFDLLKTDYESHQHVIALGNDELTFPKKVVQALFCLYLTLTCKPYTPPKNCIPHMGVELDKYGNFIFYYKTNRKKVQTDFVGFMIPLMKRETQTDTFTVNIRNHHWSMQNYHAQLFDTIQGFLSDYENLQVVLKLMCDKLGKDFKLQPWMEPQAAPATAAEGSRRKRIATLVSHSPSVDESGASPVHTETECGTTSTPACKQPDMAHLTKVQTTKVGQYAKYEYIKFATPKKKAEMTMKAYVSDMTKYFRSTWNTNSDHIMEWDSKNPYRIVAGRRIFPQESSAAATGVKEAFPEALRDTLHAYAEHTFKTEKKKGNMNGIDPKKWISANIDHHIAEWPALKTMLNTWEKPKKGDDSSEEEVGDQGSCEGGGRQGDDHFDADDGEDKGGAKNSEGEDDSDEGGAKTNEDEDDSDGEWQEVRRNKNNAAGGNRRRARSQEDSESQEDSDSDSEDERPIKRAKQHKQQNRRQLASQASSKRKRAANSKRRTHSPKKSPAKPQRESSESEAESKEAEPEPVEPEVDLADPEPDAGGLFTSPPPEERLEDLLKKAVSFSAKSTAVGYHCKLFKNMFLNAKIKFKKNPSVVVKAVDATRADKPTADLIRKIDSARRTYAAGGIEFLDTTFTATWGDEELVTELKDYQKAGVLEAWGILESTRHVFISGPPSWGKTIVSAALVLLLSVRHCLVFCTYATMDQWRKDISRFNVNGRVSVKRLDLSMDILELSLEMARAEVEASSNVTVFWLAYHGVLGDPKRSNKMISMFEEKGLAVVCDECQEYLRNSTPSSCNFYALNFNGLSVGKPLRYAVFTTATPTMRIKEAKHYLTCVGYFPDLPASLLANSVEADRNCGKILSKLRVPDPSADGAAGAAAVEYPPCAVYDFVLEHPPPLSRSKQEELAKSLEVAQDDEQEQDEPRAKSRKVSGLDKSAQAAAYRSGCGYHFTQFPPALMSLVAALGLLGMGHTVAIFTQNKNLIKGMKAEVDAMEPEHDELKRRVFYVDGDLDVDLRAVEMNRFVETAKDGGAVCVTTLGCNKSGTNKFQEADTRFMFLAGEICPDAETMWQVICRIMRQQQKNPVMVVKFTCTDESSQSMGVLSATKQVENASATWQTFRYHQLYNQGKTALSSKKNVQPVMEVEYLMSCILGLYELLKREKMVIHCHNMPFRLDPISPVKPVNRMHVHVMDLDENDAAQTSRYVQDARECLRQACKSMRVDPAEPALPPADQPAEQQADPAVAPAAQPAGVLADLLAQAHLIASGN